MSKQVTIGAKPNPTKSAEDWVSHRGASMEPDAPPILPEPPAEQMKRLTIDISAELHARIKSQCALRRIKMNDEIRVLLEQHFPLTPPP